MALRNIRIDDDPILRKEARKVETVDNRTKILIEDMFETMYDAEGVGLAAPQVGVLKQVVVIDTGEENEKMVLINPEIIFQEGQQRGPEGCLSFPGQQGIVTRPYRVTVRAMDENGEWFERTGEGLLARAFCHEIDHLRGKVYVDKVEEWVKRD
ncbi:MAG: peptide deformylase [Firmicutes bacterium]|nr:peptide deformylase [Bacillota bacterium]